LPFHRTEAGSFGHKKDACPTAFMAAYQRANRGPVALIRTSNST